MDGGNSPMGPDGWWGRIIGFLTLAGIVILALIAMAVLGAGAVFFFIGFFTDQNFLGGLFN